MAAAMAAIAAAVSSVTTIAAVTAAVSRVAAIAATVSGATAIAISGAAAITATISSAAAAVATATPSITAIPSIATVSAIATVAAIPPIATIAACRLRKKRALGVLQHGFRIRLVELVSRLWKDRRGTARNGRRQQQGRCQKRRGQRISRKGKAREIGLRGEFENP